VVSYFEGNLEDAWFHTVFTYLNETVFAIWLLVEAVSTKSEDNLVLILGKTSSNYNDYLLI